MFHSMNISLLRTASLILLLVSFLCAGIQAQEVAVIPYPSHVKFLSGEFEFAKTISIQYSDFDQGQSSHYLQEELMRRFGPYGRIEKTIRTDIRMSQEETGEIRSLSTFDHRLYSLIGQ